MPDINEQNTPIFREIYTKITLDAAMQKKISKPTRTLGIVQTVLGAITLVLYIVLTTLGIMGGEDSYFDTLLLVCGAIILVTGILLLVLGSRTEKSVTGYTNEYCFLQDALIVTSTRQGELMGQSKHYYRDFLRVRENRHFIFLQLNAASSFPVEKSALSPEDLATLRAILPLKK